MGERIPKFDDLPHILHQMGWGWLNHHPVLLKKKGFFGSHQPRTSRTLQSFAVTSTASGLGLGSCQTESLLRVALEFLVDDFCWGKALGVPLAKRVVVRTNKLTV